MVGKKPFGPEIEPDPFRQFVGVLGEDEVSTGNESLSLSPLASVRPKKADLALGSGRDLGRNGLKIE